MSQSESEYAVTPVPYPKADLVLRGGSIFRSLHSEKVDALAVWSGRVLAGGSAEEIETLIGPQTRVVELRGRSAVPGFNDAHQHLLSLGRSMMQVNLRPGVVKTMDALLSTVKAQVDRTPAGEWVVGGRYDHYYLDAKRHPLREELDRVAPDNPVFIKRTCGHMGVANSMALAKAGIDETTAPPPGGHFEMKQERLTGLLQERAQEMMLSKIPPVSGETLIAAIELAGHHMLSRGVTSIMDAAVGGVQGFDDYLAYQEARRLRRLPVRAYLAIYGGPTGIMEQCMAHGIKTSAGDERLKVGPAKIFTDGSAGGRTAAMRDPYLGESSDRGIFLYSDDDLDALVERYHDAGYQIAIHAIGDAAIDQALAAYGRVLDRSPGEDRRHRIEHCGYIAPEHIDIMVRRGIFPAPQPVFVYDFGDLYLEVLGEERSATCYPMRTWMQHGLHPAASSDAPVCSTNVMTNLYSMMTRKTAKGIVLGEGERLSLPEALSASTYNGAYLSFSEPVKGTLLAGQLADLAVTSQDFFSADAEEILVSEIDLTILEGDIVYDRLEEYASR
ncbi:MAG: amidohydrolase [Gammaproteobacteria bacterium]|nr:amidohydrolase [Gammaproteobacteria bacterium]MDX2459504.1 amidohydrolase [Gammaproteobacteria bacterium]